MILKSNWSFFIIEGNGYEVWLVLKELIKMYWFIFKGLRLWVYVFVLCVYILCLSYVDGMKMFVLVSFLDRRF